MKTNTTTRNTCNTLQDWLANENARRAMARHALSNMARRVTKDGTVYSLPPALDTAFRADADAWQDIDAEMVIGIMTAAADDNEPASLVVYAIAFRAILKVWREYSTSQAVGTPDPLNTAAAPRLYESPDRAAEFSDLLEVGAQGNDRRRAILELTAAGYTLEEIAAAYGTTKSSIHRELTAARAALAADACNDQARAARADFAEQRAALAARWLFGTERGNKPARAALAAVWREWYKRGECPTDCATSPAPRATLDALTADRAPLEFGLIMDTARRAGTRPAALALLIIGGYTPDQAAAEMGCCQRTAYNYLTRVRQALAAAGYTVK